MKDVARAQAQRDSHLHRLSVCPKLHHARGELFHGHPHAEHLVPWRHTGSRGGSSEGKWCR